MALKSDLSGELTVILITV